MRAGIRSFKVKWSEIKFLVGVFPLNLGFSFSGLGLKYGISPFVCLISLGFNTLGVYVRVRV